MYRYLQQKEIYNLTSTTDQSQRAVWFVPLKTVSYATLLLLYCYVFRQLQSSAATGDERCHTDDRILTSDTHTHTNTLIYTWRIYGALVHRYTIYEQSTIVRVVLYIYTHSSTSYAMSKSLQYALGHSFANVPLRVTRGDSTPAAVVAAARAV